MASFSEWFESEYVRGNKVGISKIGPTSKRYKNFLEKVPGVIAAEVPKTAPVGFFMMNAFDVIKYGLPLSRSGYSAVVFKADGVIYAYAYWKNAAGDEGALGAAPPTSAGPPEYVCVSPTFESRDGEYRQNFLLWADFEKAYESLIEPLSEMEEAVQKLIGSGELQLASTEYASGDRMSPGDRSSGSILSAADELRLPIRFLCALWILYRLPADVLVMGEVLIWEDHIPEAFAELIGKLLRTVGKMEQLNTARDIIRFKTGAPTNFRPSCGQKLIPLTVLEITGGPDVNFAPWRELYALQIAGELLVNFVAPSFPIFDQWTFIENTDAGFYSNSGMKDRYLRSDKARATLKLLRETRRTTQMSPGNPAPDGFVLGQVDSKTYDLIQYVLGYAVLSDISLCAVMQHVGNTIQTHFNWAARSTEEQFIRKFLFGEYQLFELLYSVWAMHQNGVIHGDLHLNNMTIAGWPRPNDKYIGRLKTVYVMGGEEDTFIWDHVSGNRSYIIDFSRATLGGAALERLRDRGDLFVQNFQRDQAMRTLRTLQRFVPQYTERNADVIKAAIIARPDDMFRVVSLVDFLAIARNVGRGIDDMVASSSEATRALLEELTKTTRSSARRLEKMSLDALMEGLREVIEGDRPRKRAAHSGAGATRHADGLRILKVVFESHLWGKADVGSDDLPFGIYNINNPMKYSGRDYALFPPWGKYDDIKDHLGDAKITDVLNRGIDPLFESITASDRIDIIQEEVRAEIGEDDAPDIGSSWIVA